MATVSMIEDHYVRIGKLLEQINMGAVFDRINAAAKTRLFYLRATIDCMPPPPTDPKTYALASKLLAQTEAAILAQLRGK